MPPAMIRARRPRCLRRALLPLLVVALATGGCGEGRTTQPPPEYRLFPSLTDPDSALFSLEWGIETKQIRLYEYALAESSAAGDADFHATFDPQDVADFESSSGTPAPADWTSSNEIAFFPRFASYPGAYSAFFVPDTSRADQRGPDSTVLYRRYRIYVGPVLFAAGMADLGFRRLGPNLEWKITRWADHHDTTAAPMGYRRLWSQ